MGAPVVEQRGIPSSSPHHEERHPADVHLDGLALGRLRLLHDPRPSVGELIERRGVHTDTVTEHEMTTHVRRHGCERAPCQTQADPSPRCPRRRAIHEAA